MPTLTFIPSKECQWWPLHQDNNTSFSSQLIAGHTLRELQLKNAASAPESSQLENAWISREDWHALADAGKPSLLQTADGTTIAWTGENPTHIVTAKKRSHLLRYPWDFITLNEQLVSNFTDDNIQGELSPAAHIEGSIHIGEGTRILPGVFVEGNVVIGKNCKVGPNCYLRGSTTIGDNCHIGQAVEIKNSIVGHGSSVGHLSYVGDSVIGNNVNFGAGTITSNLRHDGANHQTMIDGRLKDTGRRKFGAIIGDGTHTGILTAIYPGRKLGPNSSTRPNDTVDRDIVTSTPKTND